MLNIRCIARHYLTARASTLQRVHAEGEKKKHGLANNNVRTARQSDAERFLTKRWVISMEDNLMTLNIQINASIPSYSVQRMI